MKNKTAVVTGGASGIGLETCKLLAEQNYNVVLSDINEEAGRAALMSVKSDGQNHSYITADVSNYEDVKSLMDKTKDIYGTIDLLVNNAGTGGKEYKKTYDLPNDQWDKIIAINQSGVFYGMKVAIGHMVAQGSGSIVNVSSLAGIKGSQTGIDYSASKFAVVGMSKSAALEYAKSGIRVNCVCPGFTETPLLTDGLASSRKDILEKLKWAIPFKRFAQPKEIAEAIVWLGSDKASYITGQTLIVDGGLSI